MLARNGTRTSVCNKTNKHTCFCCFSLLCIHPRHLFLPCVLSTHPSNVPDVFYFLHLNNYAHFLSRGVLCTHNECSKFNLYFTARSLIECLWLCATYGLKRNANKQLPNVFHIALHTAERQFPGIDNYLMHTHLLWRFASRTRSSK